MLTDSPLVLPEERLADVADQLRCLFYGDASLGRALGWKVLAKYRPIDADGGRYLYIGVSETDVSDHVIGAVRLGGKPGENPAGDIAAMIASGVRYEEEFDFRFERRFGPYTPARPLPPEHDEVIESFTRALHLGAWVASMDPEYLACDSQVEAYSKLSSLPRSATAVIGRWHWMAESSLAWSAFDEDVVRGPVTDLALAGRGLDLYREETGGEPVHRHTRAFVAALAGVDTSDVVDIRKVVDTLDTLPAEWVPKCSPRENRDEWVTCMTILRDVADIAKAGGRTPSSLVGKFPGSWRAYARKLHDACYPGLEPEPDVPMNEAAFSIVSSILDMLQSFEQQVALPALWLSGTERKRTERLPTWLDKVDALRATTLRLLAGKKTLPALVELTAKWHRHATALSQLEAKLCRDEMPWELPHASMHVPQPDGSTISVQPLVSVRQFIEEGMAGPDSAGIDGLDHCIASYARECYDNADRFCVSVRSGKPVRRLSSAQVLKIGETYCVTEHRGRGNAVPTKPEKEAVAAFVDSLSVPDRRVSSGLPYPSLYDPRTEGAVALMLKAWSPLLPAHARDWDIDTLTTHFKPEPRTQGCIEDFLDMLMEGED